MKMTNICAKLQNLHINFFRENKRLEICSYFLTFRRQNSYIDREINQVHLDVIQQDGAESLEVSSDCKKFVKKCEMFNMSLFGCKFVK